MFVFILGLTITATGWLFLVFGIGIDVGDKWNPASVVNMHKLAMANATIHFGYMLIIAGLVTTAVKKAMNSAVEVVTVYLSGHASMNAAYEAHIASETGLSVDEQRRQRANRQLAKQAERERAAKMTRLGDMAIGKNPPQAAGKI